MGKIEFFAATSPETRALNKRRDEIERGYFMRSAEEQDRVNAAYLADVLNASDEQAFRYLLLKGLKPGFRDFSPDPRYDVNKTVKLLAQEDRGYESKLERMLVTLIDIGQWPSFEPEVGSSRRHTQSVAYRYYITGLFLLIAARPRSSDLFEAGMKVLTSGDPRIYGQDTAQKKRFTDYMLWNLLVAHQTDRRLHATWEAALNQEDCADTVSCFYPEPMNLTYAQGFTGMITQPNFEGKRLLPFDLVVPAIEGLMRSAAKDRKSGDRTPSSAMINLFLDLSTEDSFRLRDMVNDHFRNHPRTLTAFEGAFMIDQKVRAERIDES